MTDERAELADELEPVVMTLLEFSPPHWEASNAMIAFMQNRGTEIIAALRKDKP